MDHAETHQAVAAIFTAAGWAPHFGLGGYAKQTPGGWLVGGAPDPARPKHTHMKVTDKDPDTPETPDDPVEAARVLVARFAALPPLADEASVLADEASVLVETAPGVLEMPAETTETPQHETHGEAGAEVQAPEAGVMGGDLGHSDVDGAGGDDLRLRLPAELGDHEHSGTAGVDDASGEYAGDFGETADVAYDADFYEPDTLEADLTDAPQLEGAELGAEILAEEAEAEPGSVAHMYGDSLHIMRWAKKGRLDEIARQLKHAALGDWTASELREQQAQLNRFIRGEMVAGPEAQAHFAKVAEIVKEVERIDRMHETRALFLDTTDRAFIEAFDPETAFE